MTELNKAIYTVISTQFKKQAKEAHQIVEEAGYSIYKNNIGGWTVKSEKTGRCVYINSTTFRYAYIQHGPRTVNKTELKGDTYKKFDYVGALNKPINDEYYSSIAFSYANYSKAKVRYNELKSAKWHVDYEQRRIEDIQSQIKKLQRQLEMTVESKERSIQELAKLREDFGL